VLKAGNQQEQQNKYSLIEQQEERENAKHNVMKLPPKRM
jgi:hypothetical protein